MPLTREEIEAKRAEAMAARASAPAATNSGARRASNTSGATAQSRLTLARAAIRPEMKGRVMLSGPAGAGKTYTALVIATVLVGPHGRILVIDSEKESSLTYADVFEFEQLPWNPPFDPTALSLTLKEAQDTYDCVIVDSFSHFWRKQGGVLDIAGDNVRGWKAARPIQENLIETILDVETHVIVCCRSKMEHLIEDKGGGKITVTKAGIKAQQDDDLEYEVNVALELDMPHVLHIVKSRTNAVPVGAQFLAGLAGDFAQQYRDWLKSGEPVADKTATDALAARLNTIEDEGERTKTKNAFLSIFGRPEFLLVSRLAEAQQWVLDAVSGTLPVDRGEDDIPPDDHAPGAPADESASSSPDTNGDTGQTGAAGKIGGGDSTADVASDDDESALGYCDQCGGPIWRDGDTWRHAEESDDALHHDLPGISPAVDGVDVDELYATTHATTADADARRAIIEAEVGALSQVKLLKAIADAQLPATGGPKRMRALLVEHRMTADTVVG